MEDEITTTTFLRGGGRGKSEIQKGFNLWWCWKYMMRWWWVVSINGVLWISSLDQKQSDKAIMMRGTYHSSSKASKDTDK
jgi:hypothetical protein